MPALPRAARAERLEQSFELLMGLGLAAAPPVLAVGALMALSMQELGVQQVGERLVSWGGVGGGERVGVCLPGDPRPEPEPRELVPLADREQQDPRPPETGIASEQPSEQGGGSPEALPIPLENPGSPIGPALAQDDGPGRPWGEVDHDLPTHARADAGTGSSHSSATPVASTPSAAGWAGATPEHRALSGAAAMRFVAVRGGRYLMGSPREEPGRFENEGPQHPVTLSPFWLAATEVTRAQWASLMGPGRASLGDPALPVLAVSWCDAARFANALSQAEGLQPAYRFKGSCSHGGTVHWSQGADGYRLPTEAEWEFAARAGSRGLYAGGSPLQAVAWFEANAAGSPRPVASKPANALGLHDMSGNAWEWVWDHLEHYFPDPVQDPVGPERGAVRIMRGGSFCYDARFARVADRNWSRPGYRGESVGFRLARSLEPGDLDALVSEGE